MSLDPAKIKTQAANTNGNQAAAAKEPEQSLTASTSTPTTAASPVDIKTTESVVETAKETSTPPPAATTTTAVTEAKVSAVTPSVPDDKPKDIPKEPATKKKLPQYGSAHASAFKYISAKLYHPSTHYDDLRGLSIDKSGNFDLIQASTKFIGVPISGAGGRVGIIPIDKPGRLPTQIPSVLCGSTVTNFKFDPFDSQILATVSDDNAIRLWEIPEDGLEEDMGEAIKTLKGIHHHRVMSLKY